jgi:hypothetical protein
LRSGGDCAMMLMFRDLRKGLIPGNLYRKER